MLGRAARYVSARLPPVSLVAIGALAATIGWARRHPASTVGAADRAPSLAEMRREVEGGFPSSHAPLPPPHGAAPDDAFEFGLRAALARRAAAELAAELAAAEASLARSLQAGSSASGLIDELYVDEYLLVGNPFFRYTPPAKSALAPAAAAAAGGSGSSGAA